MARNLGINHTILGRWIREHHEGDGHALPRQWETECCGGGGQDPEGNSKTVADREGHSSRNEEKYSLIIQYKNTYPICPQSQLLRVSRSGYYYYKKHVASRPVDPEDQEMLEWCKKIAETSDHSYGSCRRKIALSALGFPVSRNKVSNRMKDADVQVRQRKKFKVTANGNHKQPVFENLLKRKFNVSQSGEVYAADVTIIYGRRRIDPIWR